MIIIMNIIFIVAYLFCSPLFSTGFFHSNKKWNHHILEQRYRSRFHCSMIHKRELKQSILYDPPSHLVESHTNILKNITGFYGLIGPDINKHSVKTLYDLFVGDGMVQGVFLDGTKNITFVRHFVRTEKMVFENMYGKFSKNILMTPFYILLNKLGMLPNVLGLANTAFLKVGSNIFTLFERDHPYLMNVDFENKQVYTIRKVPIDGLEHFSGHSKYDDQTNIIHTIDYDVVFGTLSYFKLDRIFGKLHKVSFKTEYIPIIHDFYVLENGGFLFIESPFVCDFRSRIPVVFSKEKPTIIHLYNSSSRVHTRFQTEESFYLFHYGKVVQTESAIEIYGPLYEEIDFSSLNIEGKYRKIMVDLRTGGVSVEKNPELETLNLDFPVQWGEYTVLRKIENRKIVGFVVCKELEIVSKVDLPKNRYFCGEPGITTIEGRPFLIGFSYDDFENGFLQIINLFDPTENFIDIPLLNESPLSIGFHSIFIGKK